MTSKVFTFISRRIQKSLLLYLMTVPACIFSEEKDDVNLRLKSKAWFQVGRIMHSSDTLLAGFNYNGNWLQSPGAQFTIEADIGENMQGAMGMGGFQTQSQVGTITESKGQSKGFERYVTEARFSYFMTQRENPLLKLDMGLFSYNYNRNIKNLGLYLFRGPVYPGILISEFESPTIDTTVANILGFHLQNNLGLFTHDIVLNSESEAAFRGNFDFSLAYLAKLNFGGVFEIGAGVNFYRLIPINKGLTQISEESNAYTFSREQYSYTKSPLENKYWYIGADTTIIPNGISPGVDSLAIIYDTTRLSHQGTKLMGQLSFDPKPLIGQGIFGENDLIFYVEGAVIGLKDYAGIYDDMSQRMPIVFGFNIPTFGFLDFLTIEVERYTSPYRNDYAKLKLDSKNSPIPVSNGDYDRDPYLSVDVTKPVLLASDTTKTFSDYDVENMSSDDIKWSLYLSKTFMNNAVISAQVANDHFRPGQFTKVSPRYETAFTRIEDWYLMFRVGYLF